MKTVKLQWQDNLRFHATTGSGHSLVLDARPEAGGENKGPRPAELVLAALGGCTGMDVASILRKMRVRFDRLGVELQGKEADDHPKVYTEVDVIYRIDGPDLPPDKVERAIALSRDRYCVVAGMIKDRVRIRYAYSLNGSIPSPVTEPEMGTV